MEYFHWAPMMLSEGMGKLEELISADNGFGRKLQLLERRLMKMEKNKYLITVARPYFTRGTIHSMRRLGKISMAD